MIKADLLSMNQEEIMALVKGWSWPTYRGQQIFTWLHNKGVSDFSQYSNIPLAQREELAYRAYIAWPGIINSSRSAAGDTIKLLLSLADGETIEMVLMLYKRKNSRDRATCCISTQTGCAMACAFCATAQNGPGRNLSAGEIVGQVLVAADFARQRGFNAISNIVYMGMGEPLLNLDNVKKSLLILNNPQGQNIGMRRITVSTCGLVPEIYQLADWQQQLSLAVSLHAANDDKRAAIMPIAKKYRIKELLEACRYYKEKTGRRITYEYALFAGINDSREDAYELGALLAGEDCLLNIIPANPVPKTGFLPSGVEVIKDFCRIVESFAITVYQREARGVDIGAACGQLSQRQKMEV
ncbi:MAG: 23S rRNA (adenine(2503)-C(2))-methyltransferase RlmN [Bacillota bacterium]|jgi:23S rRNA (adenine2503-C2)-methyltransferase